MNRFIERGNVPDDTATAIIVGSVIMIAIFPLIGMSGLKAPGNSTGSAGKVTEGLLEIITGETP